MKGLVVVLGVLVVLLGIGCLVITRRLSDEKQKAAQADAQVAELTEKLRRTTVQDEPPQKKPGKAEPVPAARAPEKPAGEDRTRAELARVRKEVTRLNREVERLSGKGRQYRDEIAEARRERDRLKQEADDVARERDRLERFAAELAREREALRKTPGPARPRPTAGRSEPRKELTRAPHKIDWIDRVSSQRLTWRGNSLLEAGRTRAAASAFTAAITADPENAGARSGLARCRKAGVPTTQPGPVRGDYRPDWIDRVSSQRLSWRGGKLRQAGRHRQAVPEYEAAVTADPENAEALKGLALSMESLGDRDRARQCWKDYLRLVPEGERRAFARRRLGEL